MKTAGGNTPGGSNPSSSVLKGCSMEKGYSTKLVASSFVSPVGEIQSMRIEIQREEYTSLLIPPRETIVGWIMFNGDTILEPPYFERATCCPQCGARFGDLLPGIPFDIEVTTGISTYTICGVCISPYHVVTYSGDAVYIPGGADVEYTAHAIEPSM